MKEKYMKPVIVFESFSLSQTIARNCGDKHHSTLGESNHYNENSCEWDLGGWTIFFMPRCDDGPESSDEVYEVDNVCYNNPDGGQEIFSST